MKKTIEERFFIVDDGFYSKSFPFVMELKTGIDTDIYIDFIGVPKKIANRSWKFFTLKNDPRLWVLSEKSILTEIDSELKEVIIISSPNIISFYINVKQLVDGSISFQVENINTKSITNYFLRQASPTANCEIMLDANKPVLLKPNL